MINNDVNDAMTAATATSLASEREPMVGGLRIQAGPGDACGDWFVSTTDAYPGVPPTIRVAGFRGLVGRGIPNPRAPLCAHLSTWVPPRIHS
jgi:hypothetical protein